MKKSKFIEEFLPISSKMGWNVTAMEETSIKLGLDPNYYQIIFDGGIDEIKDYYEDLMDRAMTEELAKLESPSKIREKIALALKIRIRLGAGGGSGSWYSMAQEYCSHPGLEPGSRKKWILNQVQDDLGALPPQPSLKSAWRTCDNIWRYAGDISTDFNHYTKRGLLTPVYLSSLKFYRKDKSENQIDTDQYITSALDRIIKVFSIKSKLPKLEDIPILRLFS